MICVLQWLLINFINMLEALQLFWRLLVIYFYLVSLCWCAFLRNLRPVWAREHCRISPPCFLAECCKRQLNQCSFFLLYFRLFPFSDLYWVCLSVFSCTVLFVSISQAIGCEDRLRNDLYCVEWGLNSTPTNSEICCRCVYCNADCFRDMLFCEIFFIFVPSENSTYIQCCPCTFSLILNWNREIVTIQSVCDQHQLLHCWDECISSVHFRNSSVIGNYLHCTLVHK